MRIIVTSVLVDDQDKALRVLHRCARLREEDRHPARRGPLADRRLARGPGRRRAAARARRASRGRAVQGGAGRRRHPVHLVRASRTCTPSSSGSSGLGVEFTQEPLTMGPVTTAVFDDTCGNLIQIAAIT